MSGRIAEPVIQAVGDFLANDFFGAGDGASLDALAFVKALDPGP